MALDRRAELRTGAEEATDWISAYDEADQRDRGLEIEMHGSDDEAIEITTTAPIWRAPVRPPPLQKVMDTLPP
ncbi:MULTISPECIES: hypothetical protein [Bradyrhizobium]|jgi:hypothetical protein|uniref:hypothetical protein n=1 Tax=Bradyrhizobium TaxID=374 RepID=UPI00039C34AD|nr:MULTISPECIES: hypothetical protein [Bradyrhizobium]MCL8483699.1 hypothetical protein [Bradyrhizobium denitrificans]RTM03565.1 MAG: hypothetical protein EKK32_08030 [Bradyrhizobiaceae bacterium]